MAREATGDGTLAAPEHRPYDELQQLADMAGLACFRVDADRNLVCWSQEMTELTGYAEADVMNLPCVVALRCPECLRGCGVFEKGGVNDVQLTLRRKDGAVVRVHKTARVVQDEDGATTGAIEMLRRDRTQPGRGDDAPLARLLQALGREWAIADDDFKVVDLGEDFAARLGRPRVALRGLPLSELLGEELFGVGSPFRNAVSAGERREGWRAVLRDVRGEQTPVSVSAGRLPGKGGAEGSIYALVRSAAPVRGPLGAELYEGMVARSAAMQRIFKLVELLRDNDATVLVTGESGTGKELVARALHARSHRARGPFVAINCGALPADLLESELFGHVRGAFTSAVRDRAGRFELADGGTLLLDEIGDMPLHLQVKLLRVLQTQSFERVGDTRTRTVDVRVIAATNVDLQLAVRERRFRDDLYYRLRVVPVEIPPLRERRDDVGPLVQHTLSRVGSERGRALRLSPSAERLLQAYPWPGNVRELENAIEYATAVCEGQTIHTDDLPLDVRQWQVETGPDPLGTPDVAAPATAASAPAPATPAGPAPPRSTPASPAPHSPTPASPAPPRCPAPYSPTPYCSTSDSGACNLPDASPVAFPQVAPAPATTRPDFDDPAFDEAAWVRQALEATHYRRVEAAALLGISRTTLWRKMKEHGLS